MRQWNYQCCTEFGYWQTAPSANVSTQKSTRSKYLTVDWFNNFFCSSKLYGKYVGPPDTNRINYRHGAKHIGTDRIIFTNGDKDPWSQLSVTDIKQSRKNRPVLIIKDGSHVTDLGTPNPKDSQSLQDAHKVMIDTIDRWVNRRY
ncbi:hypothetical protein K502DRAFT_333432 [Neoconidiobolus thromboides FSU 785]|nr:hypothetical protein K502DRAFT_333432 [Neoconidiobolus thromboides FSU 785]